MGKKKRKTTKKLRRVGKKNSTEVNGNGSVLEAGTSNKGEPRQEVSTNSKMNDKDSSNKKNGKKDKCNSLQPDLEKNSSQGVKEPVKAQPLPKNLTKAQRDILIKIAENLLPRNTTTVIMPGKTGEERKPEEMGNLSRTQTTNNNERNKLLLQSNNAMVANTTVKDKRVMGKENKISKVNKYYCKMKMGEIKEGNLKSGSLSKGRVNLNEESKPRSNICEKCCRSFPDLIALSNSPIFKRRLSAFEVVVDLISNYQKGFHDDVVDIPLANILFLLRSALDDIHEVIVEKAAMGLALLFYNESDEALLDLFYEDYGGHIQPITHVADDLKEKCYIQELTYFSTEIFTDLKNVNFLNIANNKKLEHYETIHSELAKRNLMQSLIYTRIIDRIYHILVVLRPENSTPIYCFKILIAIAHSKPQIRSAILDHEYLLSFLKRIFLIPFSKTKNSWNKIYGYPQHLVLKLYRILLSTEQSSFLSIFQEQNVIERMQEYLQPKSDLNEHIIKLQLESFRIIKCLSILSRDSHIESSFRPTFQCFLSLFKGYLIFANSHSILLPQLVAATFNAINATDSNEESHMDLVKQIIEFGSKWFRQASKYGIMETTSSTLLCSVIETVTRNLLLANEDTLKGFFVALSKFLISPYFSMFAQLCSKKTIIFNTRFKPRHPNIALSYLGAIIHEKSDPNFLFDSNTPFSLIGSIIRLKGYVSELGEKASNYIKYFQIPDNTYSILRNYLCAYLNINGINFTLLSNYFAHFEIRCLASLLYCKEITSRLTGTQMYHIIFNFMRTLPRDIYSENIPFFEASIFTSRYILMDEHVQKKWRRIYGFVLDKNIPTRSVYKTLTVDRFSPMLPKDWPFHYLKTICKNYMLLKRVDELPITSHRNILFCSFRFLNSLNDNCPLLVFSSSTEQLMYHMMAFLCDDKVITSEYIKNFLQQQVAKFLERNEFTYFNFTTTIDDISFEMLYKYLIEKFQGNFYKNAAFSALIMVPLAQKYDVKWRQLVWSKYKIAMRYITCDETMLIGGLDVYKFPREKNELLLRDYCSAFGRGILDQNSVPYKIIYHHLMAGPIPMKHI